MKNENVLFLDTECGKVDKIPHTIQLRMNEQNVVINLQLTDDRSILKKWMKRAERVVIWNATFDMGLLSSLKGNSYEWRIDKNKSGKWHMNIERNAYEVKALGVSYNFIKSYGKAPPIFDLMKYWTIMISGVARGLKDVYEEETGKKAIHYTEEDAESFEYQVQDVEILEEIYDIFFQKITDIHEVVSYNAKDWQDICTPATFAKKEYEKVYGKKTLEEWQKHNWKQDSKYGLRNALEQAYNGGITCAPYHGNVDESAWFDIHGAYAHVIMFENVDQYKHYDWIETDPIQPLAHDNHPLLCKVETETVMDKIQNSLKIYQTKVKSVRWMWSSDVLAMRLLCPGTEIVITKAFKPVPLNDVEESLPKKWSDKRESLPAEERKGPRGLFLKLMSNTSYGITAQRKPKTTRHTNMVIAGIITSRAHLILCEMINEAREMGCDWYYSDTDSICVKLNGVDPFELDEKLNERIAPYSCECELIGKSFIMSLKRYIAEGVNDKGEPEKKIKIHGKSTYNISKEDVYRMSKGEIILDDLIIKQTTANTPVGMKLCKNRDPRIKHDFPFMFIKDTPAVKVSPQGTLYTDTKMHWFGDWHLHIDTKMSVPKGVKFNENFERNFHVFYDIAVAHLFFDKMAKDPDDFDADDLNSCSFVDWDAQLRSQYGTDLIEFVNREEI